MSDILQYTIDVNGQPVTVEALLDVAQSAATLVKAGKEVLLSDEGDLAEALHASGLITTEEYEAYMDE